jgi:hypothetical protein
VSGDSRGGIWIADWSVELEAGAGVRVRARARVGAGVGLKPALGARRRPTAAPPPPPFGGTSPRGREGAREAAIYTGIQML